MNGKQHRLFAAGIWVAGCAVVGATPAALCLGLLPAVALSAGRLSPDMDNYRGWWKILSLIPGKLDNRIFGHRRITHWWGWPALVAVLALATGNPWLLWSFVVGWGSHDLGDFFFGKGGYSIPKGVPLMPWWHHVGLGFKSGGVANHMFVPVFTAEMVFVTGWLLVR